MQSSIPTDYSPSDMGVTMPNIKDPCPSLEDIMEIIKQHCKIDRRHLEYETNKIIPLHCQFLTYKVMAERAHNQNAEECNRVRARRESFYRGTADASEYIKVKWNRAKAKTKLDVENYFAEDIEVLAADEAAMNSRIRLDIITDFIKDNINWRGNKFSLALEALKFNEGISSLKSK